MKSCEWLVHHSFCANASTLVRCRYTPANTFAAAFHFTIALQPTGPLLLTHPPVWYKPELVKSDKALEDPELKPLVTKALRESKKKGKKAEGEEAK
jgi:hypothetical protein